MALAVPVDMLAVITSLTVHVFIPIGPRLSSLPSTCSSPLALRCSLPTQRALRTSFAFCEPPAASLPSVTSTPFDGTRRSALEPFTTFPSPDVSKTAANKTHILPLFMDKAVTETVFLYFYFFLFLFFSILIADYSSVATIIPPSFRPKLTGDLARVETWSESSSCALEDRMESFFFAETLKYPFLFAEVAGGQRDDGTEEDGCASATVEGGREEDRIQQYLSSIWDREDELAGSRRYVVGSWADIAMEATVGNVLFTTEGHPLPLYLRPRPRDSFSSSASSSSDHRPLSPFVEDDDILSRPLSMHRCGREDEKFRLLRFVRFYLESVGGEDPGSVGMTKECQPSKERQEGEAGPIGDDVSEREERGTVDVGSWLSNEKKRGREDGKVDEAIAVLSKAVDRLSEQLDKKAADDEGASSPSSVSTASHRLEVNTSTTTSFDGPLWRYWEYHYCHAVRLWSRFEEFRPGNSEAFLRNAHALSTVRVQSEGGGGGGGGGAGDEPISFSGFFRWLFQFSTLQGVFFWLIVVWLYDLSLGKWLKRRREAKERREKEERERRAAAAPKSQQQRQQKDRDTKENEDEDDEDEQIGSADKGSRTANTEKENGGDRRSDEAEAWKKGRESWGNLLDEVLEYGGAPSPSDETSDAAAGSKEKKAKKDSK